MLYFIALSETVMHSILLILMTSYQNKCLVTHFKLLNTVMVGDSIKLQSQ